MTLQQRIGGAAAFSLPVWLTLCAISLLATLLVSGVDVASGAGALRAATAFTAASAIIGIAFLGVTYLRRPGTALRVDVVIVLAVAISLVRSAVSMQLLNDAAFADRSIAASQLIAVTITTALTIVVANAVVETIASQRRMRAELAATLVELRHQQLQQAALGDAIDRALLTEVLRETDAIRHLSAADEAESVDERLALAAALRATASGPLRTFSHQLEARRSEPYPLEAGFLRTLMATVHAHPLWPRQTAAVSAVVSATSLIYLRREDLGLTAAVTTFAGAVLTGLIQFVLVWLALAGIDALDRRWRAMAPLAIPLAIVAIAAISLARSTLVMREITSTVPSGFLVLTIVTSVLVVLLTNAAMASQLSQESVLERLHRTIDEEETDAHARNFELVRASRTLARYVHGTLQSRLLASALAIEQAERAGDPAGFDRALEQARAALSLPEVLPPAPEDLDIAVRQTVALWNGLAQITLHIEDPMPPLASTTILDICLIVEEGVSNAMRHGAATTIAIGLTATESGGITITISDDGVGPTGGTPGLGSAVFDEAGPTPWTLTPRKDGSGAVLRVLRAVPLSSLTGVLPPVR